MGTTSEAAISADTVIGTTEGGVVVAGLSGVLHRSSATALTATDTTDRAAVGCGVDIRSPGAGTGIGAGRIAVTIDEVRN